MVADRAADAGAADRPATEIAAAETVATTAPARLSRKCNDFGRNNLCVMCSPPCVFMVGSSAKLAQLFVGTCRLTCNMTVLNTAVSTYLRICDKSPDSGMRARRPPPECPDRARQGVPLSPGSVGTGPGPRSMRILPISPAQGPAGMTGSPVTWRNSKLGVVATCSDTVPSNCYGPGLGVRGAAQHAPAAAAGVSCMWVRKKCHLDDYAALLRMQTPQRCGATAPRG